MTMSRLYMSPCLFNLYAEYIMQNARLNEAHSQSYDFSSNHVWMSELDRNERVDAFEPWCWRRLLRVPWTSRRSNKSILKEINPEYSLEGLMLKLQYFGHLMQRADSLGKTLMLGH